MTFITRPLMSVMHGYSNMASSAASFSQIQKYLEAPNSVDEHSSPSVGTMYNYEGLANSNLHWQTVLLSSSSVGSHSQGRSIVFTGASIAPATNIGTVLHDVSISVAKSAFAIVLGPAACGKTTLLRAVIGEAVTVSGSVYVAIGVIAYCGQTPWIRNTSIRENIIWGRPYDPVWYEVVVNACLLNADIQRLPEGDRTAAGEDGHNLDTSQKHRVVSSLVHNL